MLTISNYLLTVHGFHHATLMEHSEHAFSSHIYALHQKEKKSNLHCTEAPLFKFIFLKINQMVNF